MSEKSNVILSFWHLTQATIEVMRYVMQLRIAGVITDDEYEQYTDTLCGTPAEIVDRVMDLTGKIGGAT